MFTERTKKILFAVIESYIERPDPIGSGYVLKKYGFGLSSATIRNIMAYLEEMGFLNQPHTSAGRVPTDKGYRLYVDYLYEGRGSFDDGIVSGMAKRLMEIKDDINQLLLEATRTLSSLSHCLGVAVPLRPAQTTLNRIQLYRYRGRYTAAVLFTNEGFIQHKVLNADSHLTQRDLNRISEYLNSEFSGMTIEEIQSVLIRKMSKEKALCDMLISKAITLCREALNYPSSDLLVAGLSEFFCFPDFSNRLKEIAKAIEDKHLIIKLLDTLAADVEDVHVLIGSENPIEELKELSIVAASYKQGEKSVGAVGIIGPTRMDYSKAMAMVGATARCITNAISGKRG